MTNGFNLSVPVPRCKSKAEPNSIQSGHSGSFPQVRVSPALPGQMQKHSFIKDFAPFCYFNESKTSTFNKQEAFERDCLVLVVQTQD